MKKHWKMSEETKEKISKTRKGMKFSEKVKENMRNAFNSGRFVKGQNAGKKHPMWNGGLTKNKEYRRKKNQEWRNKNREKVRFSNCLRRARKRGADGSHTLGEWENLKAQYNWTCPCCKKQEPKIKLTEDHIIPLIKGGSNNIENIQPLCGSCNSSKHTKIIKY